MTAALVHRLRCRLDREDGWVLVTAIIVMAIMLGVGLAALKIVDTQQALGQQSRVRESSFNLAEGLLAAEAQILQHNWPRQAPCTGNTNSCGYVSQCTQAAVNQTTNPSNQCPDSSELLGTNAAFNNVDQFLSGASSWTVQVRDDTGAVSGTNPTYDKTTVNNTACVDSGGTSHTPCTFDANNNKRMWVRVDAIVRGKRRSLVGLLQLEKLNVPFKGGAVTAGSINFTNAGNKTIVDATGSQAVVRCQDSPSGKLAVQMNAGQTTATLASGVTGAFVAAQKVDIAPSSAGAGEQLTVLLWNPVTNVITFTGPAAANHSAGATVSLSPGPLNLCENWNTGQLQPQFNYVSQPGASSGLTAADLSLIEDGSITYPAGTCPSNNTSSWTGAIVIKSAPAGGCSMATSGNTAINSASSPGFVIVENQANPATGPALNVPNNTTFYGVIYMVNQQGAGSTPPTAGSFNPVLTLGANAQVCGGVAIDGGGQIFIGQANNGNSAVFCNNHQSGATIIYDPNAFTAFGASGAAGLVQNTWRELAPNQ